MKNTDNTKTNNKDEKRLVRKNEVSGPQPGSINARTSKLILAEGQTFSYDTKQTGLNNNVLVMGSTGSGKTVSVTEAQLLNTFDNSIVVTATKHKVVDEYMPLMKKRGYSVHEINLSRPENSSDGFDPLAYTHSDSDVRDLAKTIVQISPDKHGAQDPYWDDAATSLITAEILCLKEMWETSSAGERRSQFPPCMEDVLILHSQLRFSDTEKTGFTDSSLDYLFEALERKSPRSYAVSCWKSVSKLASRTVSCIYSTVSTAYSRLFTPQIREVMQKKQLDIRSLGYKPSALFITTSPVNKYAQAFTNLVYSAVFKELFDYAEAQPNYTLPIPVHLICDDFACGCKIPGFADYLSVIRAAGISSTLLIQSETQLAQIYGEQNASTIINNCDSLVYLGGTDITTCSNIAKRLNEPLDNVLYMPLTKACVFRRGSKPIMTERYRTYDDPEYKNIVIDNQDTAKTI